MQARADVGHGHARLRARPCPRAHKHPHMSHKTRARCVRLGVRLLKRNGGELTGEDLAGTRVAERAALDDLLVPISRAALRRSAALEDGADTDPAAAR